MKNFCNKLFTAFEQRITDNIFCFIQNDKVLMKEYLNLIAKQGDLGTVNSHLAQEIAKRYHLQNKNLKDTPSSNLIQSYSELEK